MNTAKINNIQQYKPGSRLAKTGHIIRVTIFILAALTVFFYFFSFIGIVIGIGFILFSRNWEWKAHGAVLAFAVSFSTWFSNSRIEMAPLKLTAISGPSVLFAYFISRYIINRLSKRGHLPPFLVKLRSFKWRPYAGRIFMAITVALPIFLWQSVSIDYGVLFDNSPQLLWIHAPTTVQKGKDFDIEVQCWDPYERLSAEYEGTVSFELESYDLETLELIESFSADLPDDHTFTGKSTGSSIAYRIDNGDDNGQKSFPAIINTSGIHYIKVTDNIFGKTFYSNPIIVDDYTGDKYRIFWGDVHSHSILSDGSGSLDHNYSYARDVSCLDFLGFTDHAEILLWKPGIFDYIEAKINDLNDPGEFVVFQGFEWTQTEDGHYVVIFNGDKLLKNVNYLNTPRPYDLWQRLDDFTAETKTKALALPHHATKREYIQDWTHIDPEYVKLAEVASTHGNFLFEPWHELNYEESINPPAEPQNGTSIMDALLMGHELTLYAAGDSHDGLPGHTLSHTAANVGHQRPLSAWPARNEKPYSGGITAVFSHALTREAIFEGLEEGTLYSSSDYGRPFLDLNINGMSLREGKRIFLDSPEEIRKLKIIFAQDGAYTPKRNQKPIDGSGWEIEWDARIEILKNGLLWQAIDVSGPVSTFTITDEEPVTGAEYGYEKCMEKGDEYFINDYSNQPVDPSRLNTGGVDFYIIRTVTSSGREAYIGPIWVAVGN